MISASRKLGHWASSFGAAAQWKSGLLRQNPRKSGARPNSLSVDMVVRRYVFNSLKTLFARSLSADVTGSVHPMRSRTWMLGRHQGHMPEGRKDTKLLLSVLVCEDIVQNEWHTFSATWRESGWLGNEFHFLVHLLYSMSRVWGLGRSVW